MVGPGASKATIFDLANPFTSNLDDRTVTQVKVFNKTKQEVG
jgi:hypothetical protein